MKKTYILATILSVFASVSCDKTEQITSDDHDNALNFNARIISEKTTLDEGKTKWLSTDKIAVYNGTEYVSFSNELGVDETATNVSFSGTLDAAENYWGVYPYSTLGGWNSTGPSYKIPEIQTAVTNNIQDGLDVLIAYTTSAEMSFSFSHVCAALKFTVGPASPSITEIEVVAAVNFAGKQRYSLADGTTTAMEDNKKTITLKKEDDSVFEPGDYYVMIAARKYNAGLTITFTNNLGEKATVSTGTNITASGGHVYPMGTIPSSLVFSTVLDSAPSLGDSCVGGIVAYVGADYALVLSLDQAENMYYNAGVETWIDAKGGSWRLPTEPEFVNIRAAITGGSSYTADSSSNMDIFNAKITSFSGTALEKSTAYWTSTSSGTGTNLYAFKFFNNAVTSFGSSVDSIITGDGTKRPTRAVKIVYF